MELILVGLLFLSYIFEIENFLRTLQATVTSRRRTGTSNSLSLEPRAFTGKLILSPIGPVHDWSQNECLRRRYQGHHDLSQPLRRLKTLPLKSLHPKTRKEALSLGKGMGWQTG